MKNILQKTTFLILMYAFSNYYLNYPANNELKFVFESCHEKKKNKSLHMNYPFFSILAKKTEAD